MSRYIRIDDLEQYSLSQVINGVINIQKLKTADVVEVVRCKDCSNWQTEWIPTIGGEEGWHYCGMMDKSTEPIFYCGAGERRKDEQIH